MIDIIRLYFPLLNDTQISQFGSLYSLYKDWNAKINVISRKDIENLYVHHVLHSLAIAKVIHFKPETHILDIGTGGGFPGIPLAIMFPECRFHLVDSIGKKITVVNEVAKSLELKNVSTEVTRAENIKEKFHFIVSRAVTSLPVFMAWCTNKIDKNSFNDLANGILYLKGGDLSEELIGLNNWHIKTYALSSYFDNDFFKEKKVVYLTTQK